MDCSNNSAPWLWLTQACDPAYCSSEVFLCTNKCHELSLVPFTCMMQLMSANQPRGALKICFKNVLCVKTKPPVSSSLGRWQLSAEIQFCLTDVVSVVLFIHEEPKQKGFNVKGTHPSLRWIRSTAGYVHGPVPNPSENMVWSKRLVEKALKHAVFHSQFVIRTVTEKGLTNQCRLKREKINKKL